MSTKSLFEDLIPALADNNFLKDIDKGVDDPGDDANKDEDIDDNDDDDSEGGVDDSKKAGDKKDDTEQEDEEDNDDSEPSADVVENFYNILVDNGYIDKIEDFKGTAEELDEAIEKLPERYFMEAVNSMHSDVQPLLNYIFSLEGSATMDKVAAFFEKHVAPVAEMPTLDDISDEDKAYEYLKSTLSGSALFNNAGALNKYLDALAADSLIVETAKEHLKKELDAKLQAQKSIIEEQNNRKKEQEKLDREFAKSVIDHLDTLSWSKDRKKQVLTMLSPQVYSQVTKEIQSTPQVLVQFADLLTYYDPKKKEFDFTSFVEQKKDDGKKKEALAKGKVSSILKKPKSGTDEGGGKKSLFQDLKRIN